MLNFAVVFCLRHGGEGTAAAIRWVRRPPCVRVAAVRRSYHGRRKAGFTVPERKRAAAKGAVCGKKGTGMRLKLHVFMRVCKGYTGNMIKYFKINGLLFVGFVIIS